MNYQEAMAFLEETKHYGIVPGLSSIRRLCAKLGDPQDHLNLVHIAGTNGKGAVGKMIASVLTKAGYQTGHFATPDVFCYEEIFQIDGNLITKEELADIFSDVRNACLSITKEGFPHPTKFEVEAGAAFLWFDRKKVDLAVIEVGMGGIEDATNLIQKPLVSVLTAIGMDHMQYLGGSLTEIAEKKAGIIKENCPVVTQNQDEEVLAVLREYCKKKNSPLTIADGSKARILMGAPTENRFLYEDEEYEIGLGGRFQVDNAVNAIEVLRILQKEYSNVTQRTIVQGLRSVVWPGRFERIGSGPAFFLDGAHNPPAARRLKESLNIYFTGRKIVYIMGVLADKSFDEVAQIMFEENDIVFTLTSKSPRALPGEELAGVLQKQGINAMFCKDTNEAIIHATEAAGVDGVVLAFGTLSHLGDLRRAYEEIYG
ncbi:MAG: bifunctional folylpolyglutamate synthase/dihydrofolate synthase [Lachnospiraceae bacterium]|nr:bifunctional folylpolyglutamate synthase/dihydrofolate synthase [Lachnospiraceae bacterium]